MSADPTSVTVTLGRQEFTATEVPFRRAKVALALFMRVRQSVSLDEVNEKVADEMLSFIAIHLEPGQPQGLRERLEELPITLPELMTAFYAVAPLAGFKPAEGVDPNPAAATSGTGTASTPT